MTTFHIIYITCWSSCLMAALVVFASDWKSYALTERRYRQFLFKPWKVVTFLIATTALTVAAPYTGDPTWDYVDSLFMSILTFLTAPWAVGVLYKFIRRELPLRQAFVAVSLWLFTASWSYDLYILLRDGTYPMTWFSNIFASSSLYLSAGLLWNLDWSEEGGVFFSFMKSGWPSSTGYRTFWEIALFTIPFAAAVAFMLIWFLAL